MTAPGGDGGRTAAADDLAAGIARLRRALRRGARVADPANPLSVGQLEMLTAVAEHPGIRPGQLARLLHMRPNTVTTVVNSLAAAGLIDRAAAQGDRRAITLNISEAGQRRVHTWLTTNAAVLNIALSALASGERRALLAAAPALDALAQAIDRLADVASAQH